MTALVAPAVQFTNACTNNVTTVHNEVPVELAGTSPASVGAGAGFNLSSLTLTMSLPGEIFVAGYNLGLLNDGDVLPGNVRTTIEGTNTVEGTQQTAVVAVAIGPLDITDPDGVPGTGDETVADPGVAAGFSDQTWTAGGSGTIVFREETILPLAVDQGGIVVNATIGGIITVQFRCSPGTVDPTTGLPTFTDPAPTFASTEIAIPGDLALNVIINGQTRSDALYTTVVAEVANVGTVPVTICDTDVLWDIELNGVNTTGFVLPSNPGCTELGPGRGTRFRYRWVHGPGELIPGTVVIRYNGALSFADEDTSNNTDFELAIAK